MHQLQTNKTSNLNVYVLSKTKRSRKNQKIYNINSIFYSTIVKNFTISTKQNNKMFVLDDIVSKSFRIEIEIFQQQQKLSNKKRIHTVKSNDKKMKNKNFKFIKTLENFFLSA